MTTTDTDIWADAEPTDPPEVYRSTLERYGDCPFQGLMVETGQVTSNSYATDSGSEAHDVLSWITGQYVATGVFSMDEATARMRQARPDVQPDVQDALRRMLWDFGQDLSHVPGGGMRNPNDILRYDGGDGDRSGMLAWDHLGIRVASELDLLTAGQYRDELFETDYKTGRTTWTSAKVAESFQFNLHAWLVFHNYPTVNTLYVRIWDTRDNDRLPWVAFERDRMAAFNDRLDSTIEARRVALANAADGEEVAAWSILDKCLLCPVAAASLCPRAATPALRLMESPLKFAQDTDIMKIQYEARRDQLRAYVDEHGPITGPDGYAWGLVPKKESKRAPAITAYGAYTETKGE